MGDRANVLIVEAPESPPVRLYTHWTGYELGDTVADALVRGQGRMNDAPYLTRIIFNEMTRGNEEGITGFGISVLPMDNNHPFIVVDCIKQEVRITEEDDWITPIVRDGIPLRFPFEAVIADPRAFGHVWMEDEA